MKKLLLRARAGRMLPHFQVHDQGGRRYIGRKFDASVGPNGGWPMTDEPEEVLCDGDRGHEYFAEYMKAVRDGDVYPADEATAKVLGVPFDHTFGGQEPEVHPHEAKG